MNRSRLIILIACILAILSLIAMNPDLGIIVAVFFTPFWLLFNPPEDD